MSVSINRKPICWDCKYHEGGKNTPFGYCTYFIKKGQSKKEIPRKIIYRGCKYKKSRTKTSEQKQTQVGLLLSVFEGKII